MANGMIATSDASGVQCKPVCTHERIGRHDELQLRVARLQADADRRQREVDDEVIERRKESADEQHCKREPLTFGTRRRLFAGRRPSDLSQRHPLNRKPAHSVKQTIRLNVVPAFRLRTI
jgi:hypothetical protein